MNESTAAALAHGITTKEEEKNILVYDLGGGTFDVTVLVIGKGVFEVKATLGDPNLGGSNFDFRLVNYCANVFQKKHNLDITKSDVSMCRLHVACERAKRTLSLLTEANIEIDSLYEGIDFFATITRMRFASFIITL